MATDPVCGMEVDSHTALSFMHRGQHYYFCSTNLPRTFAVIYVVYSAAAALCPGSTLEVSTPWFYGLD